MPALKLADAVYSGSGTSAPTERIEWQEGFTDKQRTSEFCESTDPAGHFESSSSQGHQEYQDRLRCIALRQEGQEKAEIATAIGRSTKFVQTWWNKDPKTIPKPPGVHEYLKTEFWRDIQIVRGFAKGLGVYEDALPATEWIDNMADGQGFKDGGARLKYDKEGRMRPNGSQYSKDGLLAGRLPKLDKVVQRLLSEQNIDDRVLKRPGMLWYPDGTSQAIPHRHEAWTALMSFGAPRILTIDNHPVLLRDGDLIVFGTQRHGVPKMCNEGGSMEDYGGRMSVVFFFMPTGQQASGSSPWKAIHDDAPSRKMVAMQTDAQLGSAAELATLRADPSGKGASLAQLVALGFSEESSLHVLKAVAFDVEKAVEILLSGLADHDLAGLGSVESLDRSAQVALLCERLAALQLQKSKTSAAVVAAAEEESDESLALRLQFEEEGQAGGDTTDWEERAILEQLQELQSLEEQGGANESLEAQFASYEQILDANDAEDWDGRGDLMVRHWRREHLQIEQQEPCTVYSVGAGSQQHEKNFFELLSLHSVRVLYDLRPSPEHLRNWLSPESLEKSCKTRGLHYRHEAL
ncbi:unnamed protein product, partial [Polarella glacialis]